MIYPGAIWRPGVNAGYASGRSAMTAAVCHYTVGRNSLPIMDRGYFNFLVARDGTIYQGAEADAVTWHAGNWNTRGPGIEVEYLDEDTIFTPEAYVATAHLVEWLIGLGIPDVFYDGDRIPDFHGFITHRALVQTGDAHHDYWPELPRVAVVPTTRRHNGMTILWINFNGVKAYLVGGDLTIIKGFDGPTNAYGFPQSAVDFANTTNCGMVEMNGEEWTRLLKKNGLL